MNSELQQVPSLSHSLEADMATGWKPKLKIIGPMPLNYDNPSVDGSLMALIRQESAFYQISYLGPRPVSSFKLHESLAKYYRYKYAYLLHNDFAHLKSFFKKFYSLFEPEGRRPFTGMNTNIGKHDLIFDSCFEGGNMDCAVRLKSHEYDILLRVDSNTAGHVLWYYFRVTNPASTEKRIKLNIVNLRRNKSAYERGMRPFVKRNDRQWQQEGQNITVSQEPLRYHKQNLSFGLQDNQPQQVLFRKLSFELDFRPLQILELAYCVPYTYSKLLDDLKKFKNKAKSLPDVTFQVDFDNESLSGLEIPIVKIRSGPPGQGKFCVFLMGRQHPGQASSSHVIKGSIAQLLSGTDLTMKVLQHCDFVIIPMLNPDGVVAGNFRTSLFGKDINRLWKKKDCTLIPEVKMARAVFTELVQTYKKKLLLFMDYHGHSIRKNAFLLGPGILDAQLMNDIRILPKIIANYSEIFRYPSCSFRLDQNRKTTARALFGRFAGLSFTVETSNWSYYSYATKEVFDMEANLFQQLGVELLKGVQEFIAAKVEAKKKYSVGPKGGDSKKNKLLKSKEDFKLRNSLTYREKQKKPVSRARQIRTKTETVITEQEQELKSFSRNQEDRPPSVREANSSDEMSESGMDSDSSGEDLEDGKFKKYIKNASDMLVEFEMIYYGNSYKKGMSKYKMSGKSSNQLLLQRDKKPKEMAVQACLRQSQTKAEVNFKTVERLKHTKRVFLEDPNIRDSISRGKYDLGEEGSEDRMEELKFSYVELGRKGNPRLSGLNGLAKDPINMTQELTHINKFDLLFFDKQNDYKRQERSTEKLRFTPRPNNMNLVLIKDKELKVTIDLPQIRNSRPALEESPSPPKPAIPRASNRFTDLVKSEQLLNKDRATNVLKLSRMGRSFKQM